MRSRLAVDLWFFAIPGALLGMGCGEGQSTNPWASHPCPQGFVFRHPARDSADSAEEFKALGGCVAATSYSSQLASAPPIVLGVSPRRSPAERAVTLTVVGQHFQPGAQVRICHQPASFVQFVSSEQLIASIPLLPGITTTCPVEVQNPTEQRGQWDQLFSFDSWQPPTLWGEPTVGGRPCDLRVGDFDGDGVEDVITVDALSPSWVTAYLLPQVPPGGSFPIDEIKDIRQSALSNEDIQPRPWSADFASGDFDENGSIDIVSTNGSAGDIRVLLNSGNGLFYDLPAWLDRFPGKVSGLATVDVNGDKHLDVVGVNTDTSELMIWLGNGTGSFARQASVALSNKPADVTLADLNQDGHVDAIVTSLARGEVHVLFGDGHGGFGQETKQSVCAQPRSLHVADFDRDGYLDWAVVCELSASVEITFGILSPEPWSHNVAISGVPTSLTLSDLDANQYIDIIVGMREGVHIYALMNQSIRPGAFSAPLPLIASEVPKWSHPFAVVTADINRDGFPDIIAAHQKPGGIAILLSHPSN